MEENIYKITVGNDRYLVFGNQDEIESEALLLFVNPKVSKANITDIVLHKLKFKEIPSISQWKERLM